MKQFTFSPPVIDNSEIGVLTNSDNEIHLINDNKNTKTVIQNIKGYNPINGDVVILHPDGSGFVLVEAESTTNAIVLTELCNSNCLACPQPPKRKDNDSTEEIAAFIISHLPTSLRTIGITGGEPTLHWERLINYIKTISAIQPEVRIELLTNGRILSNWEKAKELSEASNKNLIVAIPLWADFDTLHDTLSSCSGSFWETIEGIGNLERAGIPVELRFPICAMNYKRLPSLAEFIYRNFPYVHHVALMGLELEGTAITNKDMLWIPPSDYTNELAECCIELHRRNLIFSIYNIPLCILTPKIRRFSKKSISEWKRYYHQKCDYCGQKNNCGGIFQSVVKETEKYISPITEV